jgi:hypothetical protein
MRPRNQVQVVRVHELLHYVRAEEVACAARGETPAFDVCARKGVSKEEEEGRW